MNPNLLKKRYNNIHAVAFIAIKTDKPKPISDSQSEIKNEKFPNQKSEIGNNLIISQISLSLGYETEYSFNAIVTDKSNANAGNGCFGW